MNELQLDTIYQRHLVVCCRNNKDDDDDNDDFVVTTAENLVEKYPPRWLTTTTTTKKVSIGFDVFKSKYMDLFDKDPETANRETKRLVKEAEEKHGKAYVNNIIWSNRHHPLRARRRYDMRLNPKERSVLHQHGMVVSERLGVDSFGEAYYRLYSDDLPVYITADSILHAWHRSYDAILKELEEYLLLPMLQEILKSMQSVLRNDADHEQTYLQDADYFVAIASALLDGNKKKILCVMSKTQGRYKETMRAIEEETTMELEMFGEERTVDFSQFKPRGHYESTEALRRYFKAMMWLGRIDFRLNGEGSNVRQMQGAVMLLLLVRRAENGMQMWTKFEEIIRIFIGPVDSMTVVQLNHALEGMVEGGQLDNIESVDQLWTAPSNIMEEIKTKIGMLEIGKQLINSAVREASDDAKAPTELPQSFTFMGQRFSLDVFAMTKVVYDNIIWENEKVQRRIPSALDVAFGVFQNDDTSMEISNRALNKDKSTRMAFRDGLPYVHSLVAIRKTMDGLKSEQWSESLYSMWLDCIRQLSRPTKHTSSTFHTKAWAMRILNTQLASYTELKHDTILYTKQGYTFSRMCEYADVFVEPIPEFWTRMRLMAERSAALLKDNNLEESSQGCSFGDLLESRRLSLLRRHAPFFEEFAQMMGKLEEASGQLAKGDKLSDEQALDLKNVVEIFHGSGTPSYKGWYPKLFYSSGEDSCEWDPLVADIHTDAPDDEVGDPGCVIHQATGNVFMGLFAVNLGTSESPQSAIFAGPVFSYYEFNRPIDERMTDSEWRDVMRQQESSSSSSSSSQPGTKLAMPPLPEWAISTYLAEGENPNTAEYRHKDDDFRRGTSTKRMKG